MPAAVTPTGDPDIDKIVDVVFDLLDPSVPVSQVDHINEGIHTAINNMYRLMDQYIRAHGTASQVAELRITSYNVCYTKLLRKRR